MIDYVYKSNFLDSSRESARPPSWKGAKHVEFRPNFLENYAVFDAKKRASRLVTLSN